MTDDRDRFWDLSDLIPKKKTAPLHPFSHTVSFADVKPHMSEMSDTDFPPSASMALTLSTFALVISFRIERPRDVLNSMSAVRREHPMLWTTSPTPMPSGA